MEYTMTKTEYMQVKKRLKALLVGIQLIFTRLNINVCHNYALLKKHSRAMTSKMNMNQCVVGLSKLK